MHTPDQWMLMKISNKDKFFYKLFATWSGGYLGGDGWQLNSGIEEVEVEGDYYLFIGASGSVYKCHKNSYGSNAYGLGVIENLMDKYPDRLAVVDEDDWKDAVNL